MDDTYRESWKLIRKKPVYVSMLAYKPYMDMGGVSISSKDLHDGCPKLGGWIARDAHDITDMWYVSKEWFDANYERENI